MKINLFSFNLTHLITTAACVLVVSAFASISQAADTRPNVVVVIIDDLRWDELGYTGHPFAKTPNIDRIAHEGAQFQNAFATTALCSPSRASILTGQYPHRNGIVDNVARDAQSHGLITFPRLLHDAGYLAGFVGKWHMGNDNTARPGFDYWACLKGQGTSYDPEFNIQGQQVHEKGYVTDLLTDKAVAFVKDATSKEKPFVLFLAQKGLHPETAQRADGSLSDPDASHFIPAKRHEKLYEGAPVPRRPNFHDPLHGKPVLQREISGLPPLSAATGTSDETIRDRQRMLASIDEGIGQVIQTLEQAGQLDNTLFIVTSDHGYFYGEHGLSVERRLAYEEAIRIPLAIRYPSVVQAQATIKPKALTIDLAPTILEIAGVEVPVQIQGKSFAAALRGDEKENHDVFLIEHTSDIVFPRARNLGYKAVRGDRWKYIHYLEFDGQADELYDLKADPYELTNRIDDPEAQQVLQELKQKLKQLLPSAP